VRYKLIVINFVILSKKSQNCDFISHYSAFITSNCVFISCNSAFITHNCEFISNNSGKKVRIVRYKLIVKNFVILSKKSQNCEFIFFNSDFITQL